MLNSNNGSMQSFYQKNIKEFREEWVSLCGKSGKLNGKAINVSCFNDYIKEAAEKVFKNHGASICKENATIFIQEDKTEYDGLVLFYPQIYGVGLADEYPHVRDMKEGVYVSDLLLLLVKLIGREKQGNFYVSGTKEICSNYIRIEYKQKITIEEYLQQCLLLNKYPDRRFYDDTGVFGNLRELQKLQLKCLLEMDRICKENGIKYFLCGGTLIGALRDGGFIPWDDDIDVILDRENFNKLAEVAPRVISSEFFFQNSKTDPQYHSPYARIRLLGTYCASKFASRFDMHNEVFIDIFSQDKAFSNPFLRKIHFRLVKMTRAMVHNKWSGKSCAKKGRFKVLRRIADYFIKHVSINFLEQLRDSVMTINKNGKSKYIFDSMGIPFRQVAFPSDYFKEKIEVKFEGHTFSAPKGYDPYLTINYDENYMQWPIPSERKGHHEFEKVVLHQQ